MTKGQKLEHEYFLATGLGYRNSHCNTNRSTQHRTSDWLKKQLNMSMSLSDRLNMSTVENSYQSPMITIWCCPSLTDIQCRVWPTIKSVTLTLARIKDFTSPSVFILAHRLQIKDEFIATAVSPGNVSPLLSFFFKKLTGQESFTKLYHTFRL